jgi:transposase
MRPLHGLPPKARQELSRLLERAVSKAEYRRVLCVWLRAALGMPAIEIATVLGWSTGSVHNLHSRYLREGASALVGSGRGGRRWAWLTVGEEEELLAAFAHPAEQGGITEISAVQAALEQRVGQAVAKSTVYRLVARWGWRKLVPRPFHPDTLPAVQQAFKKSSGVWYAPRPLAKQNAVWHCG